MPTLPRLRRRNPVAMSPLLRKGGVHERSKASFRAEVKHQIDDEINQWHEAEEEWLLTNNHSQIGSGSN